MMFGGVRRRLRRLRSERGSATAPILVLKTSTPPEIALALRAGAVLLLIGAVFTVFLLDRDGLTDNLDGHVSVADVLYFTMITITTVGYGDIVPVSDQARLIDAFFVTPVRIFVWFIFLGTAYQFIIKRLVEEWRMTRLQQELQDHVVLCGYGDSGSVAAGELLHRGWSPQKIVVIDSRRDEVGRAAERGFIGLHGNASSEELLQVAAVPRARAVIVSVGRDDTTVLVVLTIREIAKQVRIIARVGEQENVKLVRSSGADVIVSPPQFGGCLMADAVAERRHGGIHLRDAVFPRRVPAAGAGAATRGTRPCRARTRGFAGGRGAARWPADRRLGGCAARHRGWRPAAGDRLRRGARRLRPRSGRRAPARSRTRRSSGSRAGRRRARSRGTRSRPAA